MKNLFLTTFLMLSLVSFAQSDFEKVIKAGEVVLSGFSILKASKSGTDKDSKIISTVCIKNKMMEKITFKLIGKDKNSDDLKKEMVVQNDGKECVFNIPKGIYTYEVILANNEVYKKGEYKFEDDIVITIKKED